MTVPALLLTALAVAVPAAPAAPAPIAYVGVAQDATPEQVAMVGWGEDAAAIVVKSIYKRDDSTGRVPTRNVRAAAVQPGQYELSTMCTVGGNPVFLLFETEFEAGKRYQVSCQGRNAKSVKVVSVEVGPTASGSTSATGK